MFSTFLVYFILRRTKRYSGEEFANIIVDGLLSHEDDGSSNESHLSSDSYSEFAYSDSSETDKGFNNNTFAASPSAKVQRAISTRGVIRRQPTSRPVVPNVTQTSDPQELHNKNPNVLLKTLGLAIQQTSLHFNSLFTNCSTNHIPENADPTFFLGLILTEELVQFMVERTNNYAQKVVSEKTMSRGSRFKNWKATYITETKIVLGLLLHMGVVNLPNLQDYW